MTAPRKLPGSLETNRRLAHWLRINADGTVTAFTGKVEIGQGILTALTQIIADELDVAPQRIRLTTAATDRGPNEGITSGSRSVEESAVANDSREFADDLWIIEKDQLAFDSINLRR